MRSCICLAIFRQRRSRRWKAEKVGYVGVTDLEAQLAQLERHLVNQDSDAIRELVFQIIQAESHLQVVRENPEVVPDSGRKSSFASA